MIKYVICGMNGLSCVIILLNDIDVGFSMQTLKTGLISKTN